MKSLCSLFFCLAAWTAAAQTSDDEYYPYAAREDRTPLLATDSALFYRAVQSAPDLYDGHASFTLPRVAVRRRGEHFRSETATTEGVGVPYRAFQSLRAMGAEERYAPGLAASGCSIGGRGGVREFTFRDGTPELPYRVSVHFSGRNYLAGARFSACGEWRGGWRYCAAADLRAGRDLYADGVFTEAFTAAFRVAKHFGEDHRIALLAVVPRSVRGTRLSSTEEAFSLTGDRLYNPAWGFQNGKVRNSRVRRETMPFAVASYRGPLTPSTTLGLSLGAEAGLRKYSALGWYDARTPMPDNYRYMPSHAGDRETEAAWRMADARYVQIDWDELIAQNRMADGHAVYALEDRAERIANLRLAAYCTTHADDRLTLDYGIFCRRESSRSYKQMRDLLGARYVADIDQFLVDDDTYGNLLQNDLRRPDRLIGEGDRFGYDYLLLHREACVRLRVSYRADRLRADVAAELGDAVVLRRGLMEKELFPGAQSFGRSRRMRFTPYTFKALAGWAFSPRSYLEAVAAAGAATPAPEMLFSQPLYNNRTVDDPHAERFYAAELNYRLTAGPVDFRCTGFITAVYDAIRTGRYFDDLAGLYCDMEASGIAMRALGAEAAAEIRLSYRWRLSLAASAGRYTYISDPQITVISDADNTAVDTRAASRMGGCSTGGAPQYTACAEAAYFGPKGWGLRLSAGYAGRRYVEPALVRRTERIARQGGATREAFDAFMRQERLGDAFTADASIFKTFYLGRSRLTAALLLHNLPGRKDTAYNGYESARVRRIRSGDAVSHMPHATRYTYAYPRSYYLSVGYKF